ncbi:HAD family hydrolase [Corynebacterium vitaeruminis]|uniref:HAD family hydrolase n=1 Tax=Corynebacterium vitaeruminis TaxID=38305 RepID=UPI0028A90A9E|nr:HAD family phosphatase [Corynebacterium vitaeruminis]
MANLLFDLYGVLIKHRTDGVRRDVEKRLGVDENHRDALWDAYHRLREPLDLGAISDQEWWATVARTAGLEDFPIEEAIQAEKDTLLIPHEDAVSLVRELIAQGHTVGVLSNIPHVLAEGLVDKHAWFKEFHSVTFSCDIHAVKPDHAAYARAVADLGTKPSETIFFDDTLGNVEAARAFGLRAVHYTGVQSITDTLA